MTTVTDCNIFRSSVIAEARCRAERFILLDARDKNRRLVLALFLGSVVLAAVQAWAYRYAMSADPISYMDMAIAVGQGRLGEAINGYWSPLYPCVVGAAFSLLRPSPAYEVVVAHLVDFLIFVFTACCFQYFWSAARRCQATTAKPERGRTSTSPLPGWVWWTMGYGLFAWTSFNWIGVQRSAPDLWLTAFIYLAAGIVAGIRAGEAGWKHFALLGLVLGFGYLAKTVMFVLAFVFIPTAGLAIGNLRRAWPRALLSMMVFLAVSAPYVTALSIKQGRLTYGDTGRINYALNVSAHIPNCAWHNDMSANSPLAWRGETPGLGKAVHPKRRLYNNPTIEEYAAPIGGSYPFWYDPTWWYEGLEAHFNLRNQVGVLIESGREFCKLLCGYQGFLVLGFGLLLLRGQGLRDSLRQGMKQWWLLLPSVASCAMFAAVAVEPRYVLPFAIMLWGAMLSTIRVQNTAYMRRLTRGLTVGCLAALGVLLTQTLAPAFKQMAVDLRWRADMAPNLGWLSAKGFQQAGIGPGDTIAYIGKPLKSWSYWASVARVRIVAELRDGEYGENFWRRSEAEQAGLIDIFRTQTKVKALVARDRDGHGIEAEGWKNVEHTPFYMYCLRP